MSRIIIGFIAGKTTHHVIENKSYYFLDEIRNRNPTCLYEDGIGTYGICGKDIDSDYGDWVEQCGDTPIYRAEVIGELLTEAEELLKDLEPKGWVFKEGVDAITRAGAKVTKIQLQINLFSADNPLIFKGIWDGITEESWTITGCYLGNRGSEFDLVGDWPNG